MITRSQWGARPPKGAGNAIGAHPKGVAIHWEGPRLGTRPHAACGALVRSIQAFHMNGRGWADVAYNFMACEHGYLFEGRGVGKGSAANGSTQTNLDYYAVCGLVGVGDVVSSALKDGLRDGVDKCRAAGAGSALVGHKDLFNTACPGPVLYALVKAGMPTAPARPSPSQPIPPTPEVDMPLTDHDLAAVAAEVWNRFKIRGPGGELLSLTAALSRLLVASDPAALAAAVVKATPATGAFTQTQLEAALRSTLGSLDGK